MLSTKIVDIQSSKPQMATAIKFTCVNSSSVKVTWTPGALTKFEIVLKTCFIGYGGGYDQTFALHAQNELTQQWTSIKTSRNEVLLDQLEPFVSYRISIESINAKGSTNSTMHNRRSKGFENRLYSEQNDLQAVQVCMLLKRCTSVVIMRFAGQQRREHHHTVSKAEQNPAKISSQSQRFSKRITVLAKNSMKHGRQFSEFEVFDQHTLQVNQLTDWDSDQRVC